MPKIQPSTCATARSGGVSSGFSGTSTGGASRSARKARSPGRLAVGVVRPIVDDDDGAGEDSHAITLPIPADSNVRLLQHRLRRLLLLVRRIAVLAQDALHEHAQLGADVLAQRPVDRDVVADGLDQLARDRRAASRRPAPSPRCRSSPARRRTPARPRRARASRRARSASRMSLASSISSSITCAASMARFW